MKRIYCLISIFIGFLLILIQAVNLWIWLTAKPIAEVYEIPIFLYYIPTDANSFNYINNEIFWFNNHGTFIEEPVVFSLWALLILLSFFVLSLTLKKCRNEDST